MIGKWNILEEGEIVSDVKRAYHLDYCSIKDMYAFTKDFKYINKYHEKKQNQDCTYHIEEATWILKDDKELLLTFTSEEIPTNTIRAGITIIRLSARELQMEYKQEDNTIPYIHLKK